MLVRPALSVARAVIVLLPQASAMPVFVKVPEPSVAATPLTLTLAIPLVASLSVPLTVTDVAIVVVPPTGDVIATDGFVLSSLTMIGAALPMSPAWLVHDPLKTSPAVSVVCDWSGVQVTGPLIVSAPVVFTVTSSRNQPFAPCVPLAVSVADGAVLSSLTVNGPPRRSAPPRWCRTR